MPLSVSPKRISDSAISLILRHNNVLTLEKMLLRPHPMEIISKLPSIFSKYHRRHAVRLRALAQDPTMAAIREHLAEAALQYDKLAESAATGDHVRE
jgi:hypothetical protein